MISDEPDEDADNLDDETLLRTYLGVMPNRPTAETATELPDWPQPRQSDLRLNLDAETVAWFKARHADWQSAMAGVLRAWAAVQMREQSPNAETVKPVSPCARVASQIRSSGWSD